MNRTFSFRFFIALLGVWCAVVSNQNAYAEGASNYSKPQLLKESEPSFSMPSDLAITPDGGYLLVADTGNNEIKVLQPGTLKILSQFGSDTLMGPKNVEFTSTGDLLVIDDGFKRATTYVFKGVYRDGSSNVKQIGVSQLSGGQSVGPYSATDKEGQTYVINEDEHQVVIFDKHRTRIGTYGGSQLKTPGAVETVGRYFWIADTGNNRILLLKAPRPAGN